jgi:predicted nucleic acid-binding protein
MPYLLDTVTLSEFRKGRKAHPSVGKWQEGIGDTWLSVITLNEMHYGMRKVERKDPAFAAILADWYRNILWHPRRFRVVNVNRDIAEQAANYRAAFGTPLPDSLIAATAKVHNLTLATRNTADFAPCGIDLVNPWEFR